MKHLLLNNKFSGKYFHAAAGSVQGQREQQQDRYAFRPHDGIFMVCDGISSLAAGDIAAQMTVDLLPAKILSQIKNCQRSRQREEKIKETVAAFSQRMQQESQQRLLHMGTTLAMLVFVNDKVHTVHMGDSHIYLFRGDRLHLTADHSLAAICRERGIYSQSNKNVISRYIGMQGYIYPEVKTIKLAIGDRFVICSDGFQLTQSKPLLQYNESHSFCKAMLEQNMDASDNVAIVAVDWRNDDRN